VLYMGLGFWAAAAVAFVLMLPRHGVQRFGRFQVVGFMLAACIAGAVMAGFIMVIAAL
jgi:hypothetical protein